MVLSDLFLTPGCKLPVYCFSTKMNNTSTSSPFLDVLFKEWEERERRRLFHRDITKCQMMILPGKHGFIATLIEGRDQKKRPTEFKIDQVLQPFNKEKFNFTKVGQEEVIFQFEESNNSESHYNASAPIDSSSSPNIVLINVSPIGYGHVLLVPRLLDGLSQRINRESLYVAICVAREARSPFFRVGYNSLGGFATINHLHFQAYYLEEEFPVERASIKKIMTLENKVKVYELSDYPVRGLVYEGGDKLNSGHNNLCDVVSISCISLQEANKPFNVLITDSGKIIFLLLQSYANKLAMGEVREEFIEMNINPAVWELSGHLVLKRRKDYKEAFEMKIVDFLSEVSLSESEFQEAKNSILSQLLDSLSNS